VIRIAWFSPLPPVRSGVAAYSAELLALLGRVFEIERFEERHAHDFVWKHQRAPYDIVVYQLGNAPCHDYMWGYLTAYPGLVVLHDMRLHHARARRLLNQERFDDYRREFRYDHPDAPPGVVEYAVEGMGGSIYYLWSMLRVVVRTARAVAVHNGRIAEELREQYPGLPVDVVRMGVAPFAAGHHARERTRRELSLPEDAMVFAVFGKVTAEKRIAAILRAAGRLTAQGTNALLLLVGDATEYPALNDEVRKSGLEDRVRVTGYVADDRVGDYLATADACLCLRWPSAGETSASWLRSLAAARPTIITDLAHLVDIPTLDARTWDRSRPSAEPIAVAVDLLDEDDGLTAAMRRLATDADLRAKLARAGYTHWSSEHTLEAMASDYRRLIEQTTARPAPRVDDLPSHFTNDYTGLVSQILREFGLDPFM